MEFAIDTHLKCPRTLSPRTPNDYTPPYPLWVGRADKDLTQVVMGYFGAQYRGEENRPKALTALRQIVGSFSETDGPKYYDLNQHLDADGYGNLIAVGYWRDPAAYQRWVSSKVISGWWASDDRLKDGIGYFREIVSPRTEQFETLYAFKDSSFPGVGAIMDGISDEIEEHDYWGSMRDRIPLSQTDRLQPVGDLQVAQGKPQLGGRVVVRGHDNVALIRSGQDWAETEAVERKLYLEEMEPPLHEGMTFLRDHGKEIGCYSNRYVQFIDLDGKLLEKTFNIGHWRSLGLLEQWAESHPTHLKIFGKFFQVAEKLSKLKLYHEVSVFDAKDQMYEYINCHARTGLIRDADTAVA